VTTPQQPTAAVYARQSKNSAKSIADQLDECQAAAAAHGFTVVATYSDGSSASRYARRRREEWTLVLAAVERHDFDVLIMWEASRGDRTLTTWSALLDRLRDQRVRVHVVNDDRTYDLSIDSDWRVLATAGVDSAHEAGKLSKRTRRGVASAARAGKPPAGPAPYGYVRTRQWVDGKIVVVQEIDPVTAPIVREIIERAGRADPISAITRDLNARGVPPPGGGSTWYRQRTRELAASPVYAGLRAHRPGRGTRHEGERGVFEAAWPALVDAATHYAAVRTLTDPARMRTARPGRQVHLLTYLAVCGRCDGPITARAIDYVCRVGHISIRRAPVDEHVVGLVLAYLRRPDVYSTLRAQGEGADAESLAARNEAAALRSRLDEWRLSAAAGRTTPESLATIEATLSREIRAAEARVARASVPPALRVVLEPGADVAVRWNAAPLPARRSVIAALVTVTLHPAGRGAYVAVEDRVMVAPRA
jgi:DNA invertase Pin-like site-specific DNA recombinase